VVLKIARALKLTLDRIIESVEAIMSLEKAQPPLQGQRLVVHCPDVFVYKMRGEYTTPCEKRRLPIVGPLRGYEPLAGVRFSGVSAVLLIPPVSQSWEIGLSSLPYDGADRRF
jgi:hypothetical protein